MKAAAKRTLRVAIIHDHLVQDGGAEQVVRSLMRQWPEAPLYTAFFDPTKMGPDFAGKDIRTSWLQRLPGAVKHYKALLPLLDTAFRSFKFDNYDVVISSASGFAKSIRTGPRTVHICYCHTPIRYLWSDSDRYISELPYPGLLKGLIKLIRPWLRRRDLRAAAGVDQFVANSEHVAKRIRRYYHRDSVVIFPPVTLDAFAPADKRENYLLIAGRLEPYKRADLAIAAVNNLHLPLKVMGSGTDLERLRDLAGPSVKFLGRVSDEQRRELYSRARALLNPQEEDFGITTVEALASGTPVIAYSQGGAREILADGRYGALFSPQTTEALISVLRDFQSERYAAADLVHRAAEFAEPRFRRELAKLVNAAATPSQ